MRYISIDPGFSTGVAWVDTEEKYCSLYTFKDVDKHGLFQNSYPDEAVIEGIPQKTDNIRQIHIFRAARDALEFASIPYVVILPGHWKPLAIAQHWMHNDAKSQHEMDAYNMLRWHILRTYGTDIGVIRCLQR